LTEKMTIRKMIYIGVMAALLCVCAWLTVPFAVPFTMQTFGVFCTLLLLGGRDGTIAIGLYILLGAAGLPVFSGFQGGIGHLLGPTGGYVLGFLLMGGVYWLTERVSVKRFRPWLRLAIGLALCYAAGTVWFAAVYARQGKAADLLSILTVCVFPYILPDAAKMALALYVGKRLKRLVSPN